jgi:signal transduction histidine kinase
MYFGSVKGMIAFRPEDLKKKTQVPPIYITAFEINNNTDLTGSSDPLSGRSASLLDSIELDYDQSTFDIEFAALDYSAPDAIRYKYRMEGLSHDWTYLNTNRKAYFTDLSPGEYKFAVQAESNISLWQTPQRTVYIKIYPPFWKSTIAYMLYISLFCLAGYLLIRTYHQTLNKRNQRKLKLFQLEKEKEVYHAKIEFFTNIAHEIQTPLTLIKGPIDWALDKIDDATIVRRNLKLVKKNIGRLLNLTAQLLDFRKTETDQFGLNFVAADIGQLIKEQLTAFKPHILEKNLDITANLPKQSIKAYVDKEALTKILGNLMSNAIKYSDKVIVISLLIPEDDANRFILRIENDGQVIPEQYKHKIFEPFYRIRNENNTKGTGIGLSLAKSLAELHLGSLYLINDPKLNIFELTLPIHQEIEFELERLKIRT